MDEGDWQLEETLAGDTLDNIFGDSGRSGQFSKAILGRDFPRRRGA